MKKYIYSFLIYCVFTLLLLPVVLLNYTQKTQAAQVITTKNNEVLWEETKIPASANSTENSPAENPTEENLSTGEKTPLEEYIIGVVAAEMPALFNIEALRAQAVAARTYAINQMQSNNLSLEDMISGDGQAYITLEEMKNRWGNSFETYYKKIETAVLSTAQEIMVYDDEPILAVFHAISCGKTETAENVWSSPKPYLKSVESPMDEKAAEFSHEITISSNIVAGLLQKAKPDLKLYDGSLKEQMQVIDRTEAGYVNTMQIGNLVFTGREVREALGLRSCDFTITQNGDEMTFKTEGYGHGAGMSQYGANFMAEEGKGYKEILEYYYSGIWFEKI